MKRLTGIACFCIATVALTSGSAFARSGEGAGPVDFEMLDTNSDGKITQDEMAAIRAGRLARADTDGDGKLSASELETRAVSQAKKKVQKMMNRFYRNRLRFGYHKEAGYEMVRHRGYGCLGRCDVNHRRSRSPRAPVVVED